MSASTEKKLPWAVITRWVALLLLVRALASCSTPESAKSQMGAEGEEVDHKVFYEGWMHPS
jgi:hypothetical protein